MNWRLRNEKLGSIEHNHNKIINNNQTAKLLNNLIGMISKLDKKIDSMSTNNESKQAIYQQLKDIKPEIKNEEPLHVPQFIPSINTDKKINVSDPKKRKKIIDLNKSLDILKKLGD